MKKYQATAIPMAPELDISLSEKSFTLISSILALMIAISLVFLAQMRSEHHRFNAKINVHRKNIEELQVATRLLASKRSELAMQGEVYRMASEELKMRLPASSTVITLDSREN